jgi:hypothetical protein
VVAGFRVDKLGLLHCVLHLQFYTNSSIHLQALLLASGICDKEGRGTRAHPPMRTFVQVVKVYCAYCAFKFSAIGKIDTLPLNYR